MTNTESRPASVEERSLREIWALKQALELLGFDPEALVLRMCESPESYWQRLALRSTLVSFDRGQARAMEPRISPAILAEAEAWLGSVRLGGVASSCLRESFGGPKP